MSLVFSEEFSAVLRLARGLIAKSLGFDVPLKERRAGVIIIVGDRLKEQHFAEQTLHEM